MNTLQYSIIILLLISIINNSSAQIPDSTLNEELAHRDTFYMIHKNVPKNKVWGNSWYTSISSNFSRNNLYDINLGRTYGLSICGGAGCWYNMRSWGLGYGYTEFQKEPIHIAKAFWENCIFYIPPFSAGMRIEYSYDIVNKTNYVQPSVGLSLFFLDIFYNYSFNLNKTENLFRHGLTLRIKYFHRIRNWQENYPNHC